MAPGLVQFAGRLPSARLPVPAPPTGTPLSEYAPVPDVSTGPTGDPPVGVADTLTPLKPPPRLLDTVPAIVPVGSSQVTVKFTVVVTPLDTVAVWLPGSVHVAGRLDRATILEPTDTPPME